MGLFTTRADPAMAALFSSPSTSKLPKRKYTGDISTAQVPTTSRSTNTDSKKKFRSAVPAATKTDDDQNDEESEESLNSASERVDQAGENEASEPEVYEHSDEESDGDLQSGAVSEAELETVPEETESKTPRSLGRTADDDDDLEEQYFRQLLSHHNDTKPEAELVEPAKATTNSKTPTDDKSKDSQTIFVGNVSTAVISEKSVYRQFQKLFAQYGEVASVRFRSIAFSEILPRKAAFIQQKLHASRDAVNAYVVYEASESAEAALALNGSVFADHHLRVDSVAKPTAHARRRSVFVGNLDFDATEESLYRHFEPAGAIEYVRIIRDSKTNMGKGFAYVQFTDAAPVQAAILLNGKSLNGRALRVTYAKGETRSRSGAKALQTTGKPVKAVPAARGARGEERLSKSERNAAAKKPDARSVGKSGRASAGASSGVKPPVRPRSQFPIVEGMRAKPGEKTSLGRKPRHRAVRKARASKVSK